MIPDCIFSGCELISGLWLGIVSSAIVAIATYIIVNRKNKKDLRRKFGKAAGIYKGYGFQKQNPANPSSPPKDILSDEPISEATIEYIRDNVLKIRVTHNNLTWEGDILMELEALGSVAWRYVGVLKILCHYLESGLQNKQIIG